MGEYSGNHPRFSRKQEERYDAKEAHNKSLSDSARLHYLENDETHHPAKQNLADAADIRDMSGAYNAMGDANHPPRQGMWDTVKKVGRTITRGLGDVGVQALDLIQPDHGSDNREWRDPGATTYYDKLSQKDWENEHYDKSRELTKQGKTYFNLSNLFDDDGAGNARTGGPRASDKLKK